jgi:hypothetical protein
VARFVLSFHLLGLNWFCEPRIIEDSGLNSFCIVEGVKNFSILLRQGGVLRTTLFLVF